MAFRTISEVADELKIPQHVLRFWEARFEQVRPLKRGGGRRYYRPEDVDLLRRIATLLYVKGYTIKGVQRVLREDGSGVIEVSDEDSDGNDETEVATASFEALDPESYGSGNGSESEKGEVPVSHVTHHYICDENNRLKQSLSDVLQELRILRNYIVSIS
nr:MerR family transcriptional regulator [Acetobacter fallax]